MITAYLKNYRQSPRKVRLVANLVKGKMVDEAVTVLNFAGKRASAPLVKLVESAIANAKNNFNIGKEKLIISDFRVDKGIVLKRMMPRARGNASRINKRTSNVLVILAEKEIKPKKEKVKKEKSVK